MKTKRDSAMAQELIPAYHDQEPSGSLYQSLLQLGMEPARQDWLSTAIPALHRKRRRMMGHVRDANGQVVFSYPLTPPEHHHANGLLPCPLSELSFMKDQAVLQLNLLNHLQSEIIGELFTVPWLCSITHPSQKRRLL